jgi:cytochrome c556
MKSEINRWVLALSVLGLVSGAVVAEETTDKQVNELRLVMQGLLEDAQQITAGIFLQDFSKIELAANKIANHPTPGMATKTKLVASLGPEMGKFKQFDSVVHDTAIVIATAAGEEDMASAITAYHQLIDGCQACHGEFKQRVAKILEE